MAALAQYALTLFFYRINGKQRSVPRRFSQMSEFMLATHFAAKLNLEETALPDFVHQGIIKPVKKNGNTYFSARDLYRLKAVLHFMREAGLSADEAFDRVVNARTAVAAH
jgi:MerR HTH family regulatory protein